VFDCLGVQDISREVNDIDVPELIKKYILSNNLTAQN